MAIQSVYGQTPERDRILGRMPRRSIEANPVNSAAPDGGKTTSVADSDYKGMFKLSVISKQENEQTQYFLDLSWPDSNYTDETVIGIFQNEKILWAQEQQVTEDTDVYFDPFGRIVVFAAKDDPVVSNWILIGNYSTRNNAVTQVLKVTSGSLTYSGYTGQFLLAATSNGVYVVSGLQKLPSQSDGKCGQAYINNGAFEVPNYSGALPESETRYFIRHTVAQTAESGDEDEDLAESEKEALRSEIAGYDATISSCSANIELYQKNIAGFQTQISTQTAMISTINNKYNLLISNANQTYQAEVTKVNAQISALDPNASDYASKKAELEQQLATLSKNLETQISGYENSRTSELNAVYSELSNLSSLISVQRTNIAQENAKIADATSKKNTACLKLYGVIPSSAKCEIVALPPRFNTSQTDQYIYYPIGIIAVKTSNGETTIQVIQTHQVGNVQLYRMGNSCEGFPE